MTNSTTLNASKSLRWKRRLGSIWSLVPFPTSRSVILIYHSVDGGPISTTVKRFEEQVAWLDGHADVVSLETMLGTGLVGADRLRVALTFDDGYRSVHDVAAPVLARYGFPATVYLNSGNIGDEQHQASDPSQGHYPGECFMTWDEVHHLREQGWTIGSHGVEHLDLTTCSDDVIKLQLADSKQMIEERAGMHCHHFSYTWGHYNQRSRDYVVEAGYHSSVACMHGPVSAHSDSFALPRLDIRQEYELSDFIAVVSGRWDYLGVVQKIKARL